MRSPSFFSNLIVYAVMFERSIVQGPENLRDGS